MSYYNIAVFILKFEEIDLIVDKCRDRMAISVELDQTAASLGAL